MQENGTGKDLMFLCHESVLDIMVSSDYEIIINKNNKGMFQMKLVAALVLPFRVTCMKYQQLHIIIT